MLTPDKLILDSSPMVNKIEEISAIPWVRLTEPVQWYDGTMPIGSLYRTYQTTNFGYVQMKQPVTSGKRTLYRI